MLTHFVIVLRHLRTPPERPSAFRRLCLLSAIRHRISGLAALQIANLQRFVRHASKKTRNISSFFGAADRTRTDTVSPPRDFKSLASAIPPQRHILFCLAFTLAVWKTHWMNIVHSSAIPPQRHIVDFLSSDNENDCSTTDCFCQQLSFDFWALCYFFFFLRSSTVTAEICFKKSASSRLSTRYIVFAPSYGKASENP